MRTAKVKDLTTHLTKVTGLSSKEREQWRSDVFKLAAVKHPASALYFKNMFLWRSDSKSGIISKLFKQISNSNSVKSINQIKTKQIMKTVEGISLIEAKVEAAKLSKGGKIISIMEKDGDFFVESGEKAGAYMLFQNGGKMLGTTQKAAKEKEAPKAPEKKESAPKSKESAKETAKAPKKPTRYSAPDEDETPKKKGKGSEKELNPKKAEQRLGADRPAVKKGAAKETRTANQPPSVVVEFIKEKQRTLAECSKFLMKAGGRSEGTVKVQVGRLKNHPNLVIIGEVVKFKK